MEQRTPTFLRNMWTAFSAVPRLQGLVVVFGLTVAGLLELLGLTTLVPLVLILDPTAHIAVGGRKDAIRAAVDSIFSVVGLSTDFLTLLLAILVFLVIKAAIGILVTRYVADLMASLNTEARLKVIGTLTQARWSFYTRQRLSRLVSAAGDSANAVGDAFAISADLLTSLLSALVYFTVCYMIAPPMILVGLGAAVVMALSYGQLVRRTKRAIKAQNKAMNQMKADLTDVFIGIKSIRAMGRQAKMATLIAKDSDLFDERMKSRVLSAEFADELQAPMIALCLVAGLVGGSMVLHLGGHELLIVAILLVRMVNTFSSIQRATQRLMAAQLRVEGARRLISDAELSQEQFTGRVVPDPSKGVRFMNVSFKHADGRALLVDADSTLR